MAVSAVILFFGIHMLISVLMVSIGSIYHIDNNQYTGLTREDINSVPSLTIAVGVLMSLFMIVSCIIRNMYTKEGYIMMSLLLLMIQLGAGIHGCVKVSDRNGMLNSTLQADMKDDISEFYIHNDTRYICSLIRIQSQLKCCGVNSPADYNISQLPASCCPELKHNDTYCTHPNQRYKDGCAPTVYDQVTHNVGIVAYVTIILSLIQIFGTLYITVKLIGMDRPLDDGTTNYHNF